MSTYIWISFLCCAFNVMAFAAVIANGRVPYHTTVTHAGAVLRLVVNAACAIWAAKLLGVL